MNGKDGFSMIYIGNRLLLSPFSIHLSLVEFARITGGKDL
jgi:hypothetical protein